MDGSADGKMHTDNDAHEVVCTSSDEAQVGR